MKDVSHTLEIRLYFFRGESRRAVFGKDDEFPRHPFPSEDYMDLARRLAEMSFNIRTILSYRIFR